MAPRIRPARPVALALSIGVAVAALSSPAGPGLANANATAQPRAAAPTTNGSWSALGSGLNSAVFTLAKGRDDTIYIGGMYSGSGALTLSGVAAWSPLTQTYSPLGSTISNSPFVFSMAVASDNSVYFGGSVDNGTLKNIARYTPATNTLTTLSSGLNSSVSDLFIKDDTLYVGGVFTQRIGGPANGLQRVAQWGPLSGGSPAFAPVGGGFANGDVAALHVPAAGNTLYAGGSMTSRLWQWGPIGGSAAYGTVGSGLNNVVTAVDSSRDDTVFIGGTFTAATGGSTLRGIAAWTPGSLSPAGYSPIGFGLGGGGVEEIAVDDTNGVLYAGGDFTYACGSASCLTTDDTVILNGVGAFDLRTRKWVPLRVSGASGVNSTVLALLSVGPSLYIGGTFTSSSSGTPVSRIATWTWAAPSGSAIINDSGGAPISVPGEAFVGVSSVIIGGVSASINYAQSSSTELVVTPPGGLGGGDLPIVVTAVGGTATVATYRRPNLPGAPTAVAASAGNASASVAWTTGTAGSSPTTRVEFALDDTMTVDDSTTNLTSPYSMMGLTNGRTYTVYVRMVSNDGPGAWSSASAPFTPSAPAPPTPAPPLSPPGAPRGVSAVPGNASALVSWSPPSDTGTLPIYGYVVRAEPGDHTCSTASASCTVTGLTNGKPYTFTVTASNIESSGPASAPSAPVTPRTVPGPPTTVTAVAGIEQAAVTWTAPAEDGGSPVTGYRVTMSPAVTGCMTDGATQCTLTGLTSGQDYAITVVAINAAGESSSSIPVMVTPRPRPTIVISGSRTGPQDTTIRIRGVVTGLDVTRVQPYYRLGTRRGFLPAISRAPVADGSFTWQRSTSKRAIVYVEAGDALSNRVVIQAR